MAAALLLAAVVLPAAPSPASAATVITYSLPWRAGQTWQVTTDWYSAGTDGHHYPAYDFIPHGSNATPVAVAAADGTVCTKALCGVPGIYKGNTTNASSYNKATDSCSATPLPNFVRIKHLNGTIASITEYDHLKRVVVEEGQPVYMGQDIGEIGNTGCSTGTHLHFQRTDKAAFYLFGYYQAEIKAHKLAVQPVFSLRAVRVSPTQVNLTWTYGGSVPTSFSIQRMTASGWRLWDYVPGTTTSYSDLLASSPLADPSYRIGAAYTYGTRYSLAVLNV
jgi:hypothetical protein